MFTASGYLRVAVVDIPFPDMHVINDLENLIFISSGRSWNLLMRPEVGIDLRWVDRRRYSLRLRRRSRS
jgi:hypothetical protein